MTRPLSELAIQIPRIESKKSHGHVLAPLLAQFLRFTVNNYTPPRSLAHKYETTTCDRLGNAIGGLIGGIEGQIKPTYPKYPSYINIQDIG